MKARIRFAVLAPMFLCACSQTHSCDPVRVAGQFAGGPQSHPVIVELRASGDGTIESNRSKFHVTWEFSQVSEQVFISGSTDALGALRRASNVPAPSPAAPRTSEGIHAMSLQCDSGGQAISLVADDAGLVRFDRLGIR